MAGLGLIGGSLGLALAERGWHVSGDDLDPARVERALAMGVVQAVGLDPLAEITFVATPVLALAARDKLAARTGRRRVMAPVVGQPGETTLINFPGTYDDYVSIAGPTWRNEVNASIALDALANRPNRAAGKVTCPALFQIADHDRCVPVHAAVKAGVKAGALIRHYPCDHFDVYPGKRWHQHIIDHQVAFLTKVLRPQVPAPL